MPFLAVIRDRFCSEQGSSRGQSSSFLCCEPCRQGADLYLQSSACAVGLGAVKYLLCLRRAAQKSGCDLKTVFSEDKHFQGTFLLRSPFLRSLNGIIFFFNKLLCSCNRNIFLLGETSFPSKCGHSLIFKCSSFTFSMGHCFLPCCVEALSLLQEDGCLCHDYFVPVLAAAVVFGASARFCLTLLLRVYSKCIHVPLLICEDGILWELPQHISCSPQATFWVTNPFLSRVVC